MKFSSRILFVLAALLLIPAYWLPLWSIGLWAPQYSDGLGMFIGLSDIWGHARHDIQNINILNHYIGMQPIEPERVTVLNIMPWVVGGLIVAGFAVAAAGRRGLAAAWIVAFVVLGTAGMYEFYSWNHDYGTNLSPDAPIKIPGMTYQPPILGSSQILNIRASSYPSWGTLFITLSLLAGALATALEYRRPGRQVADRVRAPRDVAVGAGAGAGAIALALVVLAGCGSENAKATESVAGGDGNDTVEVADFQGLTCDYCGGKIPKERFGGELVTRSGDTYHFMSVECLAGFVLEGKVPEQEIRSIRVVDFNHGRLLVDARTARYLNSPHRPSPNGLDLVAVESRKIADNLRFFFHGELLDWDEVLAHVAESWSLPAAGTVR